MSQKDSQNTINTNIEREIGNIESHWNILSVELDFTSLCNIASNTIERIFSHRKKYLKKLRKLNKKIKQEN